MSITLTPDAAGKFQFSARARMSVKCDGIQGRWSGMALTTCTGNPIVAPAWFIRQLPKGKPIVGELWMGNGKFSECQSTILRSVPDDRWHGVRFMIFEGTAPEGANVRQVEQIPVRNSTHVRQFSADVIRQGGEGAVVVDGGIFYKIKAVEDREAVIVGYQGGTGRLRGQAGALMVQDGAVSFNLGSGLTDSLRRTPPPIGATVTYSFSGVLPSGKPRFPVFMRERSAA